jgi:hypothetical protein
MIATISKALPLFRVLLTSIIFRAIVSIAGQANFHWETQVVASDAANSATIYSIVGVGAFRGHWGADFEATRDEWIKEHPRASLVTVSELPGSERTPNSKIVFIWMIQENDNLVIDLIRRGCLSAEYVRIPPNAIIKVSSAAYTRFLEAAATAEQIARKAKIGIWAGSNKQPNED